MVFGPAILVSKDKKVSKTVKSTAILFELGHDQENGNAPWVGYQDEAGMKEKILSLSEDKRTFIRAPPSGVTFEFEYATVAPVALAILAEDPKLDKMR